MIPYHEMPLHAEQNTIRILEVLPGSNPEHGSVVECNLRVASLEGLSDFSALSYTWGGFDDYVSIIVNGQTVSIRGNLENALRHIRKEDSSLNLWVDALCIDQSNDAEKGAQVQRMHLIYGQAPQTIVWLGTAADRSDMAIEALKAAGREARSLGIMDLDSIKRSQSDTTPEEVERLERIRSAVEALAAKLIQSFPYKSIRKLSERQYWRRVWVQQEFSLAQSITIRCGKMSMTGDELEAGYHFCFFIQSHVLRTYQKEELANAPYTAPDYEQGEEGESENFAPLLLDLLLNRISSRPTQLVDTRRYVNSTRDTDKKPGLARLFELLMESSVVRDAIDVSLEAQDPVDRLYGLLGMIGGGADVGIHVNYTASAEDVYTYVARLILLDNHIGLLLFARLHPGAELPSWVPDWREQLMYPCAAPDKFKPTGDRKPVPPVAKSNNVMCFASLHVDVITHVGTTWKPEISGSDFNWADMLKLFEEVRLLILSRKDDGSDLPIAMDFAKWCEGVWRIPIADQIISDALVPTRATPAAQESWELASKGPEEVFNDTIDLTGHLTRYMGAMTRLHGRRVVQTAMGFVGLAPVDVNEGDQIVLIPGLGSPLVLRPISGRNIHQIVGEAYVYGIMDGELITADTTFEVIDIC